MISSVFYMDDHEEEEMDIEDMKAMEWVDCWKNGDFDE